MARRTSQKVAQLAEQEKHVKIMITFSGSDYEKIKALQKSFEEKMRFPVTLAQAARAAAIDGTRSLIEEHKKYRPQA